MAKNDNLKDFLTDVADAIREKKGTTDKINPQDFSDEIKGIESGIAPCEWNDVNFYDYEGTILYSYTWDEFVEKNEMPPLPTHREKEGLICQEWNYTLEEVLEQGGRCDVGAIYIPEDGNTRIKLETLGNTEYYINLACSTINGVEIHWGDGFVDTNINTSITQYSHLYKNSGKYIIKIKVIKGNVTDFGIIYIKSTSIPLKQDIDEINLGNGITTLYSQRAFAYTTATKITLPNNNITLKSLWCSTKITHLNCPQKITFTDLIEGVTDIETISIPNTQGSSSQYYISSACNKLKIIHFPSNMYINTNVNTLSWNLQSLKKITKSILNENINVNGNNIILNNILVSGTNSSTIPEGIIKISSNAFYNKYQLQEINIPESCTEIGGGAFNYCMGVTKVSLPNSLKVLSVDCLGRLYSLLGCMKIPPLINNIPNYCFSGTTYLSYYDFRNHEVIPTLANTNAFTNSGNWKIVVPDALYDQWIAATNWTTYANRIVKASEFEQTNNE